MAAFSTPFSFFILSLLLSSLQIQARDSHFFNKVSRSNTPQETKPVSTPAPEPRQQKPEEFPQSENGYGLYGSSGNSKQLGGGNSLSNDYGNADLPSKYTTDEEFADEQNRKNKDFTNSFPSSNEYTTKKYGQEYSNGQSYKNKEYTTSFARNEYQNNQYGEEYGNGQSRSYKNKESTTSHPSSEYQNQQYGQEYSNEQSYKNKESTNEYQNKQYGGEYKDDLSYSNKESTTTYPASDYRNKHYGMSDTRFLENGKYFYDVGATNNGKNQYVSKGSNQGYDPFRYANAQNRFSNNGYSGNNENAYESNNFYQNNHEETEDDGFLP